MKKISANLINAQGGRTLLYRSQVAFNQQWGIFESIGVTICQNESGKLAFTRDSWSDISLKNALHKTPISIEFVLEAPETVFVEIYQEDN